MDRDRLSDNAIDKIAVLEAENARLAAELEETTSQKNALVFAAGHATAAAHEIVQTLLGAMKSIAERKSEDGDGNDNQDSRGSKLDVGG
jgi:hypothetical protein